MSYSLIWTLPNVITNQAGQLCPKKYLLNFTAPLFPTAMVLGQAFIIICFDYGNSLTSLHASRPALSKRNITRATYIILDFLLKKAKRRGVNFNNTFHLTQCIPSAPSLLGKIQFTLGGTFKPHLTERFSRKT